MNDYMNWAHRTRMSKIHKRDIRERLDTALRLRAPGQHKFAVFRLGDDVCAKCKKPRKEHPHG